MSKPISELLPTMQAVAKGIGDVLFETATIVKERMAESGQPITYPVQWDSERQRRAFFATNGFGGGIPYTRKGRYEASGVVIRQPFQTTLFKPHPAGAIGGLPSGWQSRIHRGHWPYLLTVLFEELAKLPEAISNKIQVVASQ